ncbi:hypothetical protein [Phormidium sp. CCY1219]|uniref:hypothetical protein n=1 Tax=Phormidium sp. CCY1219 TaxID=2886104 RepID=UPI002D1EEB56|nr:hypothetical protein [Phormidium sp. CCY1219]MEB3830430.1 hypothetical protein [Phormidium sp. CCY1219]
MKNAIEVPEGVSFQEAIALTQSFLSQLASGQISPKETEAFVATLVGSKDGVRGFFVAYLTDDRPFADNPTREVVQGLRSTPETIGEVLVKNVAMSAAMVVHHRREDNEEMAKQSERVRDRSIGLIRHLNLPQLREIAVSLRDSTRGEGGEYETFLQRWGYDGEQRQAMAIALSAAIDAPHKSPSPDYD